MKLATLNAQRSMPNVQLSGRVISQSAAVSSVINGVFREQFHSQFASFFPEILSLKRRILLGKLESQRQKYELFHKN